MSGYPLDDVSPIRLSFKEDFLMNENKMVTKSIKELIWIMRLHMVFPIVLQALYNVVVKQDFSHCFLFLPNFLGSSHS